MSTGAVWTKRGANEILTRVKKISILKIVDKREGSLIMPNYSTRSIGHEKPVQVEITNIVILKAK